MGGQSHRIIGYATVAAVALTAVPTMTLGSTVIFPAAGLIAVDTASRLADCDNERSTFGKKYPVLAKIFTHRGFTHTGIVLVFITSIIRMLMNMQITGVASIVEGLVLIGFVTGGMSVSMKMNSQKNLMTIGLLICVLFLLYSMDQTMINRLTISIMFGFDLAYASHIFADMHNGKGVPLLWPFCRKKIHIMDVTMGGQETIFTLIYCVMISAHLVCSHYSIGLL